MKGWVERNGAGSSRLLYFPVSTLNFQRMLYIEQISYDSNIRYIHGNNNVVPPTETFVNKRVTLSLNFLHAKCGVLM